LFFISLIAFICLLFSPSTGKADPSPPPSDSVKPPDKIVAVIPEDLQPTYFRDEKTGNAAGFAVEVMNELARLSGHTVEYVYGRPWDEMIEMVRIGKADVLPSLTIAPERMELVAFTEPIEVMPVNLIVTADSRIAGFASGLKVGALKGSIPETYMKKNAPTVEIVLFENMDQLLFNLLAGHVEAAFVLTPNLMAFAYEAGVDNKIKVISPSIFEAKRGIALRKDDTALRDSLDRAIATFIGSPEYARLYTKWYGRPKPFWTPMRVAQVMGLLLLLVAGTLIFWRYITVAGVNKRLSMTADALQATFDSVNDAIFIHDMNTGAVLDVNKKMCEMYGCSREEALRTSVECLCSGKPPYTKEDALNWIKKTAQGEPRLFEWHARRMDGSLFWVEVNMRHAVIGGERRVIVAVRDITEKKKLEDQLRQSQKMEAIGQLAGGIAHDFNNILTAIIGYASIAKMKMKDEDQLKHNIEQVLISAARAAALTQRLLAFSRKQVINPVPADLNEIIRKIANLLTNIIGEDIELHIVPADKNLIVIVDASQMEQVLMNLATNARDAMPHGGLLRIETGTIEIDDKYIEAHGYGKLGIYAMLSVTDSGIGMDEKISKRIFEPFFTTKEVGKGTGLGLSMVYGIIKQHTGYINCYSEPGKGTTFKIYLPLADPEKTHEIKTTETAEPKGGTETILLAEDDKSVRELNTKVLEQFGYTIIAACDGKDAVDKFTENKDTINLLLLDIIMPVMNGGKTYERIKQIKPDIKVIFASGYPGAFINKEEITKKGFEFISKPCSPMALVRKVREVLDS
jgi:PAS domain S-box-containing protein